jgi:aspartyl-tRNA(Asn)/glutamyl-tRNA(Gln) amidotransferase subunit B
MNFKTDIVIGLECHVELKTKTKLFCGCSRTGSDKPNTRTCEVCLGHPGSKPVLNKTAVDFALKLALAVGCDISSQLVFSRKSYFYPDMSKNYQISQYEVPLGLKGAIKLADGTAINLTRIHMEEDPAALVHPNGMIKSSYVLVDYNRSGNPLVEIVTEPEMTSPAQARDFLKQLISILKYLDIFDADESSIKADANVSIKESGYSRVEIKNINGFKEIERALNYEIQRQKKMVKEGKKILLETRAWDSDVGITRSMRLKETEADYGYIVDPDLVVSEIDDEWIDGVRRDLPELAHEKTARFIKEYKIDNVDAAVLSAQIEIAELFEKVVVKISPKLAAKWLRRELARVMNYNNLDFADIEIDETHLIDLLSMVEKKEITENVAQKILEKLIEKPFDVKEYVKKEGLAAVNDEKALEDFCNQVITDNDKVINEYKEGNVKSLNFLMGQVMRLSKGTANPGQVRELLIKLIK